MGVMVSSFKGFKNTGIMTQQRLQHLPTLQKKGYTCLLLVLLALSPVQRLWAQLGATSLNGPA